MTRRETRQSDHAIFWKCFIWNKNEIRKQVRIYPFFRRIPIDK